MGTRGFITFVVDGKEKTAYNHFDSYPSGVGKQILDFLRQAPELLAEARNLRVVTDAIPVTDDDITRLSKYADLQVSTQSEREWYCLLRQTQGNPELMLKAGVIEDAADFPLDSLFAEWGYVIDLDTHTFEVYKGFQTAKHTAGRWAGREDSNQRSVLDNKYYPVAMVAVWPLHDLPDDTEFLALEGLDE